MCDWLNEGAPNDKRKWSCKASKSLVRCTQEQKEQAVKDYCAGIHTPTEIGKIYGVDPYTIYRWKDKLLGQENKTVMPKNTISKKPVKCSKSNADAESLISDKDSLEKQVKELQQDIRRLRLEKAILEEASKVIKKGQGINLTSLTNREKAIIINALRDCYLLMELLEMLYMSKSSYCYQVIEMNNDKYADLRSYVRTAFNEASRRYGYRRIHSVIIKTGTVVSEKVIRRILWEEALIVPNVHRKKYNSYKGEVSPEVENIIERNFHADRPNTKWLTVITEFRIPSGKIYLLPNIDCFDGLPVCWTIRMS